MSDTLEKKYYPYIYCVDKDKSFYLDGFFPVTFVQNDFLTEKLYEVSNCGLILGAYSKIMFFVKALKFHKLDWKIETCKKSWQNHTEILSHIHSGILLFSAACGKTIWTIKIVKNSLFTKKSVTARFYCTYHLYGTSHRSKNLKSRINARWRLNLSLTLIKHITELI